MRRDEHGAALAGELAQEPAHPLDALGVEAVRRLVEHEHARVAEQRVGEAEALAHAQREAADLAARGVREPDEAEHLVHADRGMPAACAYTVRWFAAVRPGWKLDASSTAPTVCSGWSSFAYGDAADRRGARRRPDQAEQDPQRGGLAGAVRAEEAGHLPGLDARGEIRHGGDGAEPLRDPGEFQHLSVGHAEPSRRREPFPISLRKRASAHDAETSRRAIARRPLRRACAGPRGNVATVTDAVRAPRVLVRAYGGLGHLTLNRPRAINALDLGMIRDLTAALDAWEHDTDVDLVLLDGAGERASAPGGDVRGLARAGHARARRGRPARSSATSTR